MYYYLLKTKTEHHIIEPLIYGDYYYAVYDTKENLKAEKIIVKKDDVIEFIYNKQKKLKGKFERVDMKQEKPKKYNEESSPVSTQAQVMADFIKDELAKRRHKVIRQTSEQKIDTDGSSIRREAFTLEKAKVTKEEFSQKKDRYKITAELDHVTGIVSVEVESSPASDSATTCKRGEEVINKLLRGIVTTFPDLVDQHYITALVKQNDENYQDSSDAYFKQGKIPTRVRAQCLDSIMKAVADYQNIIEKIK